MDQLISLFRSFSGSAAILLALIFFLYINSWAFNRFRSIPTNGHISKRIISFFLILLGALAFILALPIDQHTKEQIIGFLGIIISAGIALSSTTILGNLIAGFMNNSMNRFRNGDLVKINDLMGRVIKRDIFHTEIQLEDSNIVTIPNLFIATNPVELTRKTNTVISTSVSLGYDVSRTKIETILKEAAVSADLKDPYVYITELGDDSVTYKIHGFLEDSDRYFSRSSRLNGEVMDKLHENGIEIVSPAFRNQRNVDEKVFIPEQTGKPTSLQETPPEELIFDEAIEAEEIEKKRDFLKELDKRKEDLKEQKKNLKDPKKIEKIEASIDHIRERQQKLEKNIEEQAETDRDRE